jgi:hypothetical protein
MGLTWNGFHALKWALLERHLKLWGGIEKAEIEILENTVYDIDVLSERAGQLPV